MPNKPETRHGIEPEFLDAADRMLRDNVDEIRPIYRASAGDGTAAS